MNLGQSPSLDFQPGDPFTILVAYRVTEKTAGTFLAKGGGAAADRAYQLYLSQGRIGSITFGAMKEQSVPVGAGIAVQVCDDTKATVFWGGEPSFSSRRDTPSQPRTMAWRNSRSWLTKGRLADRLSETCFLVSYSHARLSSGTSGGDNTNSFALYLIDVHGNKELVHRDLTPSCASPMPLGKRPRPPVLPNLADLAEHYATCYVGSSVG